MLNRARRYLDPNAQPGTGGAGSGGNPDPSPGPRPNNAGRSAVDVRLPAHVETEFQSLVHQRGSAEHVARSLFDENFRLRRKMREQKKAIEAFETRNPQGSIVLHGEALANYRAYEQLGKPAEIKTKLEAGDRLAAEAAETKKREARTKAAGVLKWNPLVLDDRMHREGLELEIRTETGPDGKAKDVPYVRKAGEANATWESLEAKAGRDWKDPAVMAALKAVAPASGGNGAAAGNGEGSSYVTFPDNGGGNGASSSAATLLESFTKQRAEAARAVSNPLQSRIAGSGTK